MKQEAELNAIFIAAPFIMGLLAALFLPSLLADPAAFRRVMAGACAIGLTLVFLGRRSWPRPTDERLAASAGRPLRARIAHFAGWILLLLGIFGIAFSFKV